MRKTAKKRRSHEAQQAPKPQSAEISAPAPSTPADSASDEARGRMIAIAAYYRAERRGFAPGYELEDWLAAEVEIETQLARRVASAPRGSA